MRKISAVAISFLLILTLIIGIDMHINIARPARGSVIYVGGGGLGNYSTIQEGIDAANPGDTVFVYNGTYLERIKVNKTLNLVGENRSNAIIFAPSVMMKSSDVIQVTADWVNITGLSIMNAQRGINVGGFSNGTISDNIISYNDEDGIYGGPTDWIITNNTIHTNGWAGINLGTPLITNEHANNIVFSNILQNNNQSGITLEGTSGNHIHNNILINNGWAIYSHHGEGNNISNNYISSNSYGIYLRHNDHWNNITGNTIKGNNYGIYLFDDIQNNTIIFNNVLNNGNGIFILDGSPIYDNYFHHNNFINNTNQSRDWGCLDGQNYYDNGYPSGGNFWSDYNGSDFFSGPNQNISGSDGIGDTPYIFNYSQDNYPLMWPTYGGPVHNIDSDRYFSTIQAAIYDPGTLDGHTIVVRAGTYNENVVINKSVSLIGKGWDNTAIEAGGEGDVIYINASWVNVTGLSISGGGAVTGDSGIELDHIQNCRIYDNKISFNDCYGIYLNDADRNIISANNASGNYIGVCLRQSNANTITGNDAGINDNEGILLDLSHGNNVTKNMVHHNLYDGICLSASDGNNIVANTVSSNTWYGIFVWDDSDGNLVTSNIVSNNEHGILLFEYCNDNIVFDNTISKNDWGIDILDSNSINNKIHHNNIIENMAQAKDETGGGNQWDDGYPSGGNFWSDYTGVDFNHGPGQNLPGSDGIGDTPYGVSSDQDDYPLMEPYGNVTRLKQGWNLISIPLNQEDESLGEVLLSIQGCYDGVQWYNAADGNDPWKHNNIGKPWGNDLTLINETMGLWININQSKDVFFHAKGNQHTAEQLIPLYMGWNLVGFPSHSDKNITMALNNLILGTHVDSVWTLNTSTHKWQEIGRDDYFELGRGYWIHAMQDCVWEVPL